MEKFNQFRLAAIFILLCAISFISKAADQVEKTLYDKSSFGG